MRNIIRNIKYRDHGFSNSLFFHKTIYLVTRIETLKTCHEASVSTLIDDT